MSTIHFSAVEWGWIVSRWVASGALPFKEARELAAISAYSNAKAYAARYQETVIPDDIPSADEIEAEALPILAKPETWLAGRHCGGGVAYNCAEDPDIQTPRADLGGESLLDFLKPIEDKARNWLEALERAKTRKEENDSAYAEEGPLPVVEWSEIAAKAQAAGMLRVIVAEFGVDQSDSQQDYHGGRTARSVVIGLGKGKRESFRELRQAAAAFPPTEYIAFDRVSVVTKNKDGDDYGSRRHRWEDEHGGTRFFRSVEEATAALAELHAKHPQCQPGYTGCVDFPAISQAYGVDFRTESPENRENYSMGGGNYLGWSRYGGWSVSSQEAGEYLGNRTGGIEFFEAPAVVKNGKTIKAAPVVPKKPRKEPIPFPVWTKRGLLQKTAPTIDWPHVYRKAETAQKDVEKLAALGIVADVTEGRGRAAYFVRLVSQPAETPAPPAPAPVVLAFDLLSVL